MSDDDESREAGRFDRKAGQFDRKAGQFDREAGRFDREAGQSDREAWYEDRSGGGPRPWELATGESETPSVREYLRRQHEEGMSRRDLTLTVLGALLLVLVPAALVGSILTLLVFPLVDNPLLWWIGLTATVLVLMLAASEVS